MIQHSHFWTFTQRKWKWNLKEISALPCSLIIFIIAKIRKHLSVHQQMNGWKEGRCGIYVQQNVIQLQEGNPAFCIPWILQIECDIRDYELVLSLYIKKTCTCSVGALWHLCEQVQVSRLEDDRLYVERPYSWQLWTGNPIQPTNLVHQEQKSPHLSWPQIVQLQLVIH